MTCDYLICEMHNNTFTVNASAIIDNKRYRFPIKIDTGCTHSVLPFRVVANVTKRESKKIKRKVIANGMSYLRSYGVSDTEVKKAYDRVLIRMGLFNVCTALKFLHENLAISLNGFEFSSDIYINYDRTSTPLIGLDILQKFSFHCDVSQVTGKYTFIGCPRNQKNKKDFSNALLLHFGCINIVNT